MAGKEDEGNSLFCFGIEMLSYRRCTVLLGCVKQAMMMRYELWTLVTHKPPVILQMRTALGNDWTNACVDDYQKTSLFLKIEPLASAPVTWCA